MNLFKIADEVIAQAYPGKPGWWGAQRIPNYGILRGAIAGALETAYRHKRAGKTCPRCKGLGLIPIDMNRGGKCWRCKGKGKIPRKGSKNGH